MLCFFVCQQKLCSNTGSMRSHGIHDKVLHDDLKMLLLMELKLFLLDKHGIKEK